MKAQTVNTMNPFTCSITDTLEECDQKSIVNLSQLNPRNAVSSTKARMGRILATVVTRLRNAAWRIPRVRPKKMSQVRSDTAIAEAQRFSAEKSGR